MFQSSEEGVGEEEEEIGVNDSGGMVELVCVRERGETEDYTNWNYYYCGTQIIHCSLMRFHYLTICNVTNTFHELQDFGFSHENLINL